LVQQKFAQSLKGDVVLSVTVVSQEKKTLMVDKAKSLIVLCLGKNFLRDVAKKTNTTTMWSRFKSLYMTNFLAHRQFLKQQLCSFSMVDSKTITEQLVGKILDGLENIEVNLEDEDNVILLLCALPRSYENF